MEKEKHKVEAKANKVLIFNMYDEDMLKNEFMGSFTFDTSYIYALQEASLLFFLKLQFFYLLYF